MGHEYCAFYVPLLWLCRRRFSELPIHTNHCFTSCRIDNLESLCDWFVIGPDANCVALEYYATSTIMELPAINFEAAKDWAVSDGDIFTESFLVSESLGIESRLCNVKACVDVVFDADFHFPDDPSDHPPNLPSDGSIVQREVAGAAVAAQPRLMDKVHLPA